MFKTFILFCLKSEKSLEYFFFFNLNSSLLQNSRSLLFLLNPPTECFFLTINKRRQNSPVDIGNVIMKTLNVSVNVIGEMMLLRKCHKSRDFGIFWVLWEGRKMNNVTSFGVVSVDEFVIFYPLMMFFHSLLPHPKQTTKNLITFFFRRLQRIQSHLSSLYSTVGEKQFHEEKMSFPRSLRVFQRNLREDSEKERRSLNLKTFN